VIDIQGKRFNLWFDTRKKALSGQFFKKYEVAAGKNYAVTQALPISISQHKVFGRGCPLKCGNIIVFNFPDVLIQQHSYGKI